MEIKVGNIYEHVNTGRSYVVTSISLLKINGEWFEKEPLVTYTNQGVHYSRLESDFKAKFKPSGLRGGMSV